MLSVMGYARKSLVSLQDTPYYHLIGRCVRRAWLWGFDEYAGKDYSHRKQWVLDRLARLSQAFAVDICSYAIMSNHYHLVVRVDQQRAAAWDIEEVIERWGLIFKIPPVVGLYQSGEATKAERQAAEKMLRTWRLRLHDVSWYMRCLNEYLARRANVEDQCRGRFWESRFKSQALLDDRGLVTAMAYVDLNPVRAGIAATPETSDFTSVKARVDVQATRQSSVAPSRLNLLPFREEARKAPYLPFTLKDYLQLLDWTGRQIRPGKRGRIDAAQPPILERLQIDQKAWRGMMQSRGNRFGRALGSPDRLRAHAISVAQAWIRGLKQAAQLFPQG